MNGELVDPDGLIEQLKVLKSINVDGVMVDCWWGIVEAHTPEHYDWNGYKRLFQIVRDLGLKLQVFHVPNAITSLLPVSTAGTFYVRTLLEFKKI